MKCASNYHEVMTRVFKIRLRDFDTKRLFLTVGRTRQIDTESEREKREYFCMFFRKVLIIMTGPPWTWAPAEVTNAWHCQFV